MIIYDEYTMISNDDWRKFLEYTNTIEALRAENARLQKERDDYYRTYRTMCDEDVEIYVDTIARLREQIHLLTEDMPARDARRIIAEQHAEIERLRRLPAG